MHLSDHDLRQLNEAYLASLTPEQLLRLMVKLLADHKKAREQLNQTTANSSRPSGSFAPWASSAGQQEEPEDEADEEEDDAPPSPETKPPADKAEKPPTDTKSTEQKKPGRQKGAPGHGRRAELAVTRVEEHRPEACACCETLFPAEAPFVAWTGVGVLDLEMGQGELKLSHVKHLYGDVECEKCGHVTRTEPGRCEAEEGWQVALTDRHLVGPTLAALIVCLALRMRLPRRLIQEFLEDWLQVHLSIGVLNKTITESGRAVAPLEEELVQEVQQAELVHVDETGWKEGGRNAWLWVLTATGVTLFLLGNRSWAVIADVLEQFGGWLMSDGYGVYRRYGQRLRCLAHLVRKARGLAESLTPGAQEFGEQVSAVLGAVIAGVYRARAGPDVDLRAELAEELAALKQSCEAHRESAHQKTRALARELLNDWDTFWQVLDCPELPLTNNAAERALRHWVIARKISQGTRTAQGSRAFTLLASVIETCRQRGVSPWPYLAQVIAARRKGQAAPPLPASAT